MSEEFFTACERLLSATANGVYQGILVTVIAGLALRWCARTNAATRYAVWFGVLLFVMALIPAHLLLSGRSRPEIRAATRRPASSTMAAALAPPDFGITADAPDADGALPDSQLDESDADSIDGTACSPGAGTQAEWASKEAGSKVSPDAAAAEKAWSRITRAIFNPLSRNLQTDISLPHSICLCLVSAWVLLASVRGGLILGRIGEVRRVKTKSSVPSHGLQTLFDRLRDSLAARRNVRLRISSAHRTAVVLGFVHPVVLLPAEMDTDANECEVELVLRHELAHVVRRDDWGNLAQQLIQAALFFHPAVWWISARLSLEREIACDDCVLERGGRPRNYALALANFAVRMTQCRHLLAPGVSNNNSQLQQRITMILDTNRDRSPRLARTRLGFFTTATALLAVLAIDAGPRLVLAQPPPAPTAATEPENATPPAPPAPPAPVADGVPAGLPPDGPGADSGPRTKSADNDNDNDNAPDASQPQSTALVAPLPATPAVAADEAVPEAPEPPEPPIARLSKRHMSVEERLDRIERILEELQARAGTRGRHHSDDDVSVSDGKVWPKSLMAMPMNLNIDLELKHAEEQARRAADQVRHAVEASQRAAEAGQRNAEQAMRDVEKLKGRDFERLAENMRDVQTEGLHRALQALREARESLDRQKETLDRQIQRLEQDQSRQKKTPQSRPEDPDDGPKAKAPAAAQTN